MKGNPYDILGMETIFANGKIIHPDAFDIRKRWWEQIREWHPSTGAPEGAFRAKMAAGLFLMSIDGDKFRAADTKPEDLTLEFQDYTKSPIPRWEVIYIQYAQERMLEKAGDFDGTVLAAEECGFELNELPGYLRADVLSEASDFDTEEVFREVVRKREGFFKLMSNVEIVWRRNTWKSRGATAIGKARKLSAKERSLHPDGEQAAPLGCVELCLAYWAIATPEDRERLLFHELCHFELNSGKLSMRPHDIETFVDEQRVYGLWDETEGQAFAAASQHPSTKKRLRTWDLAFGQLSFLSPNGTVEYERAAE